jgi:hypothetical protein
MHFDRTNLSALSGFYCARDGGPVARLDEITAVSSLEDRIPLSFPTLRAMALPDERRLLRRAPRRKS